MIEYHEDAAQELEETALWYEVRRAGLGLRLYASVSSIEDLILEFPLSGAPVIGRGVPRGIRKHVVRGFPISVVYLTDPFPVIVAVEHGRRKPGYWRERLSTVTR